MKRYAGDAVDGLHFVGARRSRRNQHGERAGIGELFAELEVPDRTCIRVPVGERRTAGLAARGHTLIGYLRYLLRTGRAKTVALGDHCMAKRAARRENGSENFG